MCWSICLLRKLVFNELIHWIFVCSNFFSRFSLGYFYRSFFFFFRALKLRCRNAPFPDKFGHYREVSIVQIKHHWWWKVSRSRSENKLCSTFFIEKFQRKKFNKKIFSLSFDSTVFSFLFVSKLIFLFCSLEKQINSGEMSFSWKTIETKIFAKKTNRFSFRLVEFCFQFGPNSPKPNGSFVAFAWRRFLPFARRVNFLGKNARRKRKVRTKPISPRIPNFSFLLRLCPDCWFFTLGNLEKTGRDLETLADKVNIWKIFRFSLVSFFSDFACWFSECNWIVAQFHGISEFFY